MQKSLLRKTREELGWTRASTAHLVKERGYKGKCDAQKIQFLEDKKSKPRDESFLRCLCDVLTLSIDDVARDLRIVPEKIRQAYFEDKIRYEEGH
jgi:hypothetical protein